MVNESRAQESAPSRGTHDAEWYETRRSLITSTDIPAILGVDSYRSEGDVARDKLGEEAPEPDAAQARRFRLGLALEDVVKVEEEAEHGLPLRRVRRILTHPTITWAGTSLDFVRVGERTIVEVKTSSGRGWEDGLPERVEAQVRWQMGVAGYPNVHIATLRYGRDLVCYDVVHEPVAFDNLVLIAADFMRRLVAGGPFSETRASMRRAFPYDDGTEVSVTNEDPIAEAVVHLIDTRANIKQAQEHEDRLVEAIQARMRTATGLTGPGFRVTWKRSKPRKETEWRLVAEGLRTRVTTDEWESTVAMQTTETAGARPFVVKEVNS